MPVDITGYKIFIAMPGGLKEEREAFREMLREYNEIEANRRDILFMPVGREITLGRGVRPRECDYFILVVWDRLDSSPYPDNRGPCTSGVEEEYNEALECFRDKNAPMRQLIGFFKAVDESKLSDPGEQLKKVIDFRDRLGREKTLLYTIDEIKPGTKFQVILRAHLADWVIKHGTGGSKGCED